MASTLFTFRQRPLRGFEHVCNSLDRCAGAHVTTVTVVTTGGVEELRYRAPLPVNRRESGAKLVFTVQS